MENEKPKWNGGVRIGQWILRMLIFSKESSTFENKKEHLMEEVLFCKIETPMKKAHFTEENSCPRDFLLVNPAFRVNIAPF